MKVHVVQDTKNEDFQGCFKTKKEAKEFISNKPRPIGYKPELEPLVILTFKLIKGQHFT